MNPIATGVAAALISGVVMFTLGAKATQLNAFSQNPALDQTADGQFAPASYTTALRPAATPSAAAVTPISNTRRAPAPRRTVSRTAGAGREIVGDEDIRPERSWGKTAMIVGGSAASGAGVGGIVAGKKGALIGAAIGGGTASIYEATRRR
jgi:hypothetical protein